MAKRKGSRGSTVTQEDFDLVKQLLAQEPKLSKIKIAAMAKRGVGTIERINEAADLEAYRRLTFEEYKKYAKHAVGKKRSYVKRNPILIANKEEEQLPEAQEVPNTVSTSQLLKDLERAIAPSPEDAVSLRLLKRLDRIAELMEKLMEIQVKNTPKRGVYW